MIRRKALRKLLLNSIFRYLISTGPWLLLLVGSLMVVGLLLPPITWWFETVCSMLGLHLVLAVLYVRARVVEYLHCELKLEIIEYNPLLIYIERRWVLLLEKLTVVEGHRDVLDALRLRFGKTLVIPDVSSKKHYSRYRKALHQVIPTV